MYEEQRVKKLKAKGFKLLLNVKADRTVSLSSHKLVNRKLRGGGYSEKVPNDIMI